MGLVQYFVIVLISSAQLVFTTPLMNTAKGGEHNMCRAGEYKKSGTECQICPDGSFKDNPNLDDSCELCYRDCRPDYHLKVVQPCTRTSDIKCSCEAGFECTEMIPYTKHCAKCVKIQQTTTASIKPVSSMLEEGTSTTDVTSGNDEQTRSSNSSQPSNFHAKPCQSPECVPQPVPPTTVADAKSSPLAAILIPVVVVGCVALVVLFCVRQPGDETCFKRAIAKLCTEGRRASASLKSKESSHQFPRDSFIAKQQPPPLAAANLGPVHVHNPGTVIFSLISQFTGQVGSTTEGAKAAERVAAEEDEERDSPVCHPTSSPSVHLSEEEGSGEMENMFFPSQEQGKDYHVSKEEEQL
ncbi:tumor necrosis factor receptor superfamily member 3 [Pleuronectes platessa]|uniref:tumor necrosis factor receptor superfamily member 3 n=1 Tax=Pleuronectes platessa TaxID=8262 RepID=UPI00232A2B0B|nr:tumor necrosis factor receptor superfamily member 3 [Pleuronectes platessa]